MNIMKALMLAGLTSLSLGLGTAVAQEGGSTYVVAPDYWAPSTIAVRAAKAAVAGRNRSGSSDVDPPLPQDPYSGAHTGLFTFGP